ncbi:MULTISPECIES: hypothetical protein [Nocardiopsis]|uniref:hypothetical protein n=1 Tax=Nocardiopsis TaxID=2013 RepID=UPI0011802C89|nr:MULTISPECIES: hypothetical protein [Nocardiopsis]
MQKEKLIFELTAKVEYASILVESEQVQGDADHGDWNRDGALAHLLPGSLVVGVRAPEDGAVAIQVIRGDSFSETLPIVAFSGEVDSSDGRFFIQDHMGNFRLALSSSGLFEIRVDEFDASRVQIIFW